MLKTLLKAINIGKFFGKVKALQDINLEIKSGEVVGIVGSGSAGKSLLAEILAGNVQANTGQLLLENEVITKLNPAQIKRVGIEVFYQNDVFANNINILSNIFIGREIYKSFAGVKILDIKEMKEIATQKFSELSLNVSPTGTIQNLSSSELQLLNFSRFLLNPCKLAIFDEPTSSLNPEQASTVTSIIRESVKSGFCKSVLFIGHDVKEVMSLCDRIIILKQGKIIAKKNTTDTTFAEVMDLISGDVEEKEANLRVILNAIGDAVIASNIQNNIIRMNPIAEKLTGMSFDEVKGKHISEAVNLVDSSTMESIDCPACETLATGKTITLNKRNTLLISNNEDTNEYLISASSSPIFNENGKLNGVVSIFRDITKESHLQAKLYQSQKLESIGQLAGGVAHDFNNMLSGIMGCAELLKSSKNKDEEKQTKYIDLILKTAERAAELTAKLSAFGRKGKIQSVAIDFHDIIPDAADILKQTIDKKIEIIVETQAENSIVIGDRSGLQNSIMNLGINAWHAMPNSGSLMIVTRNIYLNEQYCSESSFELTPGDFLEISISDTGCGIPQNEIKNIFEPFFTTKEQGKGTGLGLSAVYGMVQDHDGAISVYSEEGAGTTFNIYLPCAKSKSIKHNNNKSINEDINKHTATILLVDDESLLRTLGKALLEESGHKIILAENGKEAVDCFKENKDDIDIIILDMIMPIMNGEEAFTEIKNINPNQKIIIASGFTKNSKLDELAKRGIAGFIHKPFRKKELNDLIESTLS